MPYSVSENNLKQIGVKDDTSVLTSKFYMNGSQTCETAMKWWALPEINAQVCIANAMVASSPAYMILSKNGYTVISVT